MIRKNMEETQEKNKRLELSEKLTLSGSQSCQPALSIAWLPGQDSNLQPSGYKLPDISTGLGLSLHRSYSE